MSGYTNCACRDCMDVTVSSNPARPELCELCHEAGCGDPDATSWPECQREDAYDAGAEPWQIADQHAAPCKWPFANCRC